MDDIVEKLNKVEVLDGKFVLLRPSENNFVYILFVENHEIEISAKMIECDSGLKSEKLERKVLFNEFLVAKVFTSGEIEMGDDSSIYSSKKRAMEIVRDHFKLVENE